MKMSPMEERVTLNRKEQKKLMVLNLGEKGEMIGRQAAEVLGLCLRQVQRRKPWKRKLYKGDIFTGHHHINFKVNLNFIIWVCTRLK